MEGGRIKPREVGFSPAIGRSLLARLSSKWIPFGRLFLAKDCWMRRQHAIRVVFRFGGHETGPYLGTVVGLPFSRGNHHRVGSVAFATDGGHLREELPVAGQERGKRSFHTRFNAAKQPDSE